MKKNYHQQCIILMLAVCLMIVASACNFNNPLPLSVENISCHKVEVAPGPEDFVLDTWHAASRLLVSSHDRRHPETSGGIFWFDLETEKSGEMKRVGEPETILAFKPHGMDIIRKGGRTLLYVILHDPRGRMERAENAIAVYAVDENRLWFETLLEDAACLWSPNDLSVLPSGDIYVTNDYTGNMALYFRTASSEIAFYDQRADAWKIVADDLAFANGILAEKDQVYVSVMFDEELMAFPRKPDGTLGAPETVVRVKGGDNIMKYRNWLLLTAHYDDLAFLRHMKHPEKPSPSIVFAVRPEIHTKNAVYVDDGTAISAASTALAYKRKLYISQVFDPYILVCDLPAFMK